MNSMTRDIGLPGRLKQYMKQEEDILTRAQAGEERYSGNLMASMWTNGPERRTSGNRPVQEESEKMVNPGGD